MKKLVSSAAFAMLIALAGSATAPADNGPPGFVYEAAIQELALQADLNAPQYALAATVASNDFRAPAAVMTLEQTASSATRGAPEVAVLTDTFMSDSNDTVGARSAYYNLNMNGGDHAWYGHSALWHDPGDSSAGAQRAQVA